MNQNIKVWEIVVVKAEAFQRMAANRESNCTTVKIVIFRGTVAKALCTSVSF